MTDESEKGGTILIVDDTPENMLRGYAGIYRQWSYCRTPSS